MKNTHNSMRFEGTLTTWNDERGFGRIEPNQCDESLFVHISAWPRGSGRPRIGQFVTFEIEPGTQGKRALNVQLVQVRRPARTSERATQAQWGTATVLAIPALLVFYTAIAVLWTLPIWVAGLYFVLSVVTFIAYAIDKAAATRGSWRTPESTLHTLAIAGGWPGALLAQQLLRHKSKKQGFRQVFWATVMSNIAGLVALATPVGQSLLRAL